MSKANGVPPAVGGLTARSLGYMTKREGDYLSFDFLVTLSATAPYLIADKYQLMAVKDLMATDDTKYFKMLDDINMENETWTRLNPSPFTAAINFDGNGKTITKLNNAMFQDVNGTVKDLTLDQSTVSAAELLGVFACHVNKGATITNVDVSNSSVDASSNYCGGLIGQSASDIPLTVSGVDVTNTSVTGSLAGGIVGYPQGATTISDCHYDGGTITSKNQYTGGIVGATASGKTIGISDCSVKNATFSSAYNRLGGLIGAMRNGTTVERCTVGESGENKEVVINMTGTAACYTGGFIGLMEGGEVKDNCIAYVKVTGVKTSIGGFIGRMTAGKISGCKSYGSVSGPGTIGGFFGDVTGATEIKNNESNCSVTATSTFVGGFVGQFKGSLSCSGCSHKSGKVASSLGGGSECYIGGFAGYIGNKSEAFTGTVSGCFVSNANVDAVKYKSNGSAESSGAWVGGFAGGIGHSTYANNTGKVEKCGVYHTSVSGGNYCGGFAGVSYSAVEKCRVNGTPTVQCYGNSNGGLNGYQQGHSVKYCYSNAKVRHSNKSNVGGLIGNAKNTSVEECYSAGDLENSTTSSSSSTTWGGMIGVQNTVTVSKLIRWNHSNNASISGGETSVPSGCYVKQSSDNNFTTIATSLGWSTDGSIWTYKEDGTVPTLVGV